MSGSISGTTARRSPAGRASPVSAPSRASSRRPSPRCCACLIRRPPRSPAGRTPACTRAARSATSTSPPQRGPRCPGALRRRRGASLVQRLAGLLPPEIRVHRAAEVPSGFDARFSALARRYAYRICDDPAAADPLRRDVLVHRRRLDVAAHGHRGRAAGGRARLRRVLQAAARGDHDPSGAEPAVPPTGRRPGRGGHRGGRVLPLDGALGRGWRWSPWARADARRAGWPSCSRLAVASRPSRSCRRAGSRSKPCVTRPTTSLLLGQLRRGPCASRSSDLRCRDFVERGFTSPAMVEARALARGQPRNQGQRDPGPRSGMPRVELSGSGRWW